MQKWIGWKCNGSRCMNDMMDENRGFGLNVRNNVDELSKVWVWRGFVDNWDWGFEGVWDFRG
ncbi:hypothetical protein, partial [Bacillus sp. WP8]|uniref:hypothetical protein n=1 Tax=Bacillus sp. WP8 TaxID=756828 RepID=UPI001C92DE47